MYFTKTWNVRLNEFIFYILKGYFVFKQKFVNLFWSLLILLWQHELNRIKYTYLPTYLPTYIHTYIHTNIHTYKHTYIPTYIHTCIDTYKHTYIHKCKHALIHTCLCLPSYLYTYIHIYMMAVHSLNEHDHRWLLLSGHETGSDFWNQQVTCILFHKHSKQNLSVHTYIHTYIHTYMMAVYSLNEHGHRWL